MPSFPRLPALIVLVFTVSMLVGCPQNPSGSSATGKPVVVCTTQMVEDLVKRIVGDAFEVSALFGSDVDPHLYKPYPSDNARLSSADLIVYSGLHLEGNLQPALESLSKSKKVIAVTALLERDHRDRLIQLGEHLYDPHVWHDVALWKLAGDGTLAQLCELYPEQAETFTTNWEQSGDLLVELDEYCRTQLAGVPVKQLVTGHDAFSYFGRAYGMEVLPIQGVTTENEASVKKINELVTTIVTKKIGAIFVESTLNDRNSRALVEGAASRGQPVKLAGPLYSDATGPAGSGAEDYPGMIRANIKTIVEGLGGVIEPVARSTELQKSGSPAGEL